METRTLSDYWMALYSNKKTILLTALMAGVFAYVISVLMPPIYEAKSAFYLPHQAASERGGGLSQALSPAPLLPFPEEKSSGANVGILHGKDIKRAVQAKFPSRPLKFFSKNVDFKVGQGFAIEVYVRDTDPVLAAKIANAFPIAFDEFQSRALAQRGKAAERALLAQLEQVNSELYERRKAIQSYKEKNLMVSSGEGAEQRELAKNFEQELRVTRANVVATRERVKKIEQQLSEERKGYSPNEEVVTNPQIEALKQTITALEINTARPRAELQPSHMRLKELQIELTAAKQSLNAEIARLINSRSKQPGSVYENLRTQLIEKINELKYLEAKLDALVVTLNEVNQNMQAMAPKLLDIEAQQNEKRILEELQTQIGKTLPNVKLQSQFPQSTIVFLEHAFPPEQPAFPIPLLNVIVASIFGFIVGAYYVLFLDYLKMLKQNRIRRQMDLAPLARIKL